MSGENDRTEGKWNEAKGKVKEAVGDATNDEELEREGKADQTKGKAKEAFGHLKDAGDRAKEALTDD